MKQIKIVRFACCLACVCILLAGCRSYDVRVFSQGSGGIQAARLLSVPASYKGLDPFQREGAAKEFTVTFLGKEYHGTYMSSEQYSGTGVVIDEYAVRDGSMCRSFHLNSADQSLTAIFLSGSGQEFWEAEKDTPVLDENTIHEKARQIAGAVVDLNDYSIAFERIRKGNATSSDLFEYRFCRMAQGIETTDYLDILISEHGNLVYLDSAGLGWVKERQKDLQAFSLNAATESAKKASGLTNPTVTNRRFGISSDGIVFLMVSLSGSGSEMPVDLAVTVQ